MTKTKQIRIYSKIREGYSDPVIRKQERISQEQLAGYKAALVRKVYTYTNGNGKIHIPKETIKLLDSRQTSMLVEILRTVSNKGEYREKDPIRDKVVSLKNKGATHLDVRLALKKVPVETVSAYLANWTRGSYNA